MFNRLIAEKLFSLLDKAPVGQFHIQCPDGSKRIFGNDQGLVAFMEVYDWRVFTSFLRNGEIGLTETYRDGLWDSPDLTALLTLGLRNMQALGDVVRGGRIQQWIQRGLYRLRENSLTGSRKNIQAHYDLGNDFYQLWLDPGMSYSAALYNSSDDPLLLAQDNKYDRMLDGLESDTGSLLEIGCGWGGFAERALKRGDYAYRGVTLSDQQQDYASRRVGKAGEVVLEDYRLQQGSYRNIVSIEMFEAVGEKFWPVYFDKLKSLLHEKGKAMIQTITIREEHFESYRNRGDMIRTFIFPGGMLPSSERFVAQAQKSGLRVEDLYEFGPDYAATLEAWLASFESQLQRVRQIGFDEAFIRIWRFYLCACIAAFRTDNTNVMQVRLAHA